MWRSSQPRGFRVAAALAALSLPFTLPGSAAGSTVPGATTARTAVPPRPTPRPAPGKRTPAPRPAPKPAPADRLLFCNQPERLTRDGAYAEYRLKAGTRYRIFYHYRNTTKKTAPLTLAFTAAPGAHVRLTARKGIAAPANDPPTVGRDALRRYLAAPEKAFAGRGSVRFTTPLRSWDTASGIVTVVPEKDLRMRITFGTGSTKPVPGAHVAAFDAPKREIKVTLTDKSGPQYVRIGQAEKGMPAGMDGAYGLVYALSVAAPQGRTVRVTFSPRGGHAGLVASLDGRLVASPIVGAAAWATLTDVVMGARPLSLVTLPFGGVFYPVELAFHLK